MYTVTIQDTQSLPVFWLSDLVGNRLPNPAALEPGPCQYKQLNKESRRLAFVWNSLQRVWSSSSVSNWRWLSVSARCAGGSCWLLPCWLLIIRGVGNWGTGSGCDPWLSWRSSWLPAMTSACRARCARTRSAKDGRGRVWTSGPVCLLRLETLDRRPGTCLQPINLWSKTKQGFTHSTTAEFQWPRDPLDPPQT